MWVVRRYGKNILKTEISIVSIVAVLALAFVLPSVTADSPC